MSNPIFAVNASSPFQCISSPTAQAASPSSPSAELFDVDESMSDIMSAILQRSSSPDYSTTSEESGSFEEVKYDRSLAKSIVSSKSTASTKSTVSIESDISTEWTVLIESTVSTKETLNEDADDEQSSSNSYESSVNRSPKIVYQGSLNFEGSISNEIAEGEDGPSTKVDEGIHMLFEHERIRLKVDYHCRTGTPTDGVPRKDCICLEVKCYRKSETQASKKSKPREDENGFVTTTSHMEEVINSPGEEHMLSERMGQTTQVNDTDIWSPMSIDFLTDTPSPPSIHGDNPFLNHLTTPSSALPNPDFSTLLALGSSSLNSPQTHAHPKLLLRYSLPSSRHHPYTQTP
ncbi:hypothetical protein FRC12_019259 [Ceratobasidium sp. 428]|nr:hypothetical protein FRC12_019259 [Ceratobasidium sp. 428]